MPGGRCDPGDVGGDGAEEGAATVAGVGWGGGGGGAGLWQPGGEPEPEVPAVVAVVLLLLALPRRITQVEMARFGGAFQPLRHPVAGISQGSPALLSC